MRSLKKRWEAALTEAAKQDALQAFDKARAENIRRMSKLANNSLRKLK
jgi:hypothetical protein